MALEPITRQEQIIAGKDLEPITRMEKFLKQYRGGSGGGTPQGGAPFQQLVTNGEGEAVWEERLAYEEQAFEPIVWDANVEVLERFAAPMGVDFLKISNELIPNATGEGIASAVLEGTAFDGTYMTDTLSITVLNDGWGLLASDGMPYVSVVTDSQSSGMSVGTWILDFAALNVSAVIKINPTTTLKTIDPKYLPGGGSGGGVFVVNFTQDENYDFIADKTFDEIIAALANGIPVIGIQSQMDNGNLMMGSTLSVSAYNMAELGEAIYFATPVMAAMNGTMFSMFEMKKDGTVTASAYTVQATKVM